MSAQAWWLLSGGIAIAALFGLYLSMTAGRLDRLHRRIDSARSTLDVLLARRWSVTAEIAGVGALDPAAVAVLVDAVHEARARVDGPEDLRWLSESDLTQALGEVFDDPLDVQELCEDPGVAELLAELAGTCRRVQLARRFLNDGVRACRQVRRQRLARWLRLAGRTPWPTTVEMDDTPPAGLVGR